MIKSVYTKTQVARKEYQCNACLWVACCSREAWEFISFADRRLLVRFLRWQQGKILPGQRYERQTYSVDGELYTIFVHPDIDRIAKENDLYPPDMT